MAKKSSKPKTKKRKTASKPARKKTPAKKVSRKKPVAMKMTASQSATRQKKISNVTRTLALFAVLFILSVVIASVSGEGAVNNLFWIVAILTAFVAVALLIVLLIFVFLGRRRI